MNKDELEKILYEKRFDTEKDFNKLIVYISTGALVFSIGFTEKVLPLTQACHKEFLKLSWIFFGVTLCLILTSYFLGIKAFDRYLESKIIMHIITT